MEDQRETSRDQIEDRIVDFFAELFDQLFTNPFSDQIGARLKRRHVQRAIGDASDAASQTITRLLVNQRVSLPHIDAMLASLARLDGHLPLPVIGNANVSPESLAEDITPRLPQPDLGDDDRLHSIYRVTLQSIVQVVTLVGPVMAEWQKVGFAETFEVLKRVIDRLNRMSAQLDVLGRSGLEAADKRFELTYRDYLMQRFHRVEAGTVKMTTNLNVDLRELFVMPRALVRKRAGSTDAAAEDAMMDLSAARQRFAPMPPKRKEQPEDRATSALMLALQHERLVIIGTPGSGKSTFLEWLQIQVPVAETELVLAGKQAIPLLLRIRQLDPDRLPTGSDLVAAATASSDRASLAPAGWTGRMLGQGRILFILDGLDEIAPEQLRARVLPWLQQTVRTFPRCRYLISSRPSGYPPGTLQRLEFVEAELLDFDRNEIAAYTCHWCVAVRLARNEPDEEARREGKADGERIVAGFREHPYINDLAHSPLMLSAICLVNWFEGGQLPADRAMLYRLCVEGLLHHWDQRRGIHSDYTLSEKLRVSRELAIAMQADDRAEYEAAKVQQVFVEVLGNEARAAALLEHIRFRTGLLIERRPGVFAFAHLTFQEYLAAQAVHEGNRRAIDVQTLVENHADPRWREVIPLYAGSGTEAAALEIVEMLMAAPDSGSRGELLADAFLACERGLSGRESLRGRVIEIVAGSTAAEWPSILNEFSDHEVALVANRALATRIGPSAVVGSGQAFRWLHRHTSEINREELLKITKNWRKVGNAEFVAEILTLAYLILSPEDLETISKDFDLFLSEGPKPHTTERYFSQAEIVLYALYQRRKTEDIFDFRTAMLNALRAIAARGCELCNTSQIALGFFFRFLRKHAGKVWMDPKCLNEAFNALASEDYPESWSKIDMPCLIAEIDAILSSSRSDIEDTEDAS